MRGGGRKLKVKSKSRERGEGVWKRTTQNDGRFPCHFIVPIRERAPESSLERRWLDTNPVTETSVSRSMTPWVNIWMDRFYFTPVNGRPLGWLSVTEIQSNSPPELLYSFPSVTWPSRVDCRTIPALTIQFLIFQTKRLLFFLNFMFCISNVGFYH